MGGFFTSVHVRAGHENLVARVATAIRGAAAAAGFESVNDQASADRRVVILPPDEGGWVAIYDEDAQSSPSALASMARLASRAAAGPAVSIMVHDSDLLVLGLFDDGAPVDTFNSWPDYFGPLLEVPRPADPNNWAGVLAAGNSPSDLRSVFEGRRALMAEETLTRCARLFGMDEPRACASLRDLPSDPDAARSLLRTVRLAFRAKTRPQWEDLAVGPPKFEPRMFDEVTLTLAVGDPLRASLTVANDGGAGRGVRVLVYGDALDQKLVTVDRFELIVGQPHPDNRHEVLEPEAARDTHGRSLLVASATEQAIPAGAGAGLTAFEAGGLNLEKAMTTHFTSQIHVNVMGHVTSPGRGELLIALAPEEHHDGGLAQATIVDVTVSE